MHEEELRRIERGSPTSPVEIVLGLFWGVALIALIVFIVCKIL